jgi:hypothetical protein
VLNHFKKPIFPRRIYTPIRKQIEVKNELEISRYFREANFSDCRINAYPVREEWAMKLLGQEPDVLFIDLDREDFQSKDALEDARLRTLRNIRDKLNNGYPSVLDTGNGYHIYQPIDAFVLETESVFKDYVRVSERFLKFAEWYLSGNRADSNHNPTFASCLLRVPGTINSSTNREVRIVQEWDGHRPNIRYILLNYETWLVAEEYKRRKIESRKLRIMSRSYESRKVANIDWIDNLINEKPLRDSRKFACYWIISRYLINVRHLNCEQSYAVIMKWLKRCNEVQPLTPSYRDFDRLVRYNIKQAQRSGKVPIGKELLHEMNKELNLILFSR